MTEEEERKASSVWAPIADQLGALVGTLSRRSSKIEGRPHDPRIVSVFLLRRLKAHRNAFVTLTNEKLQTDAEIVLRAAVETAICLVNLNTRKEAFIEDLRSDASRTVRGQLPIWFSADPEFGKEVREGLDPLFGASRADGKAHKFFDWQQLANDAAAPELYRWYKHLSATAAHVTGVSVFLDEFPIAELEELRRMRRVQALSMMCGVTAIGGRAHGNTLEWPDLEHDAREIMVRMSSMQF